jgi:hypothetical protein
VAAVACALALGLAACSGGGGGAGQGGAGNGTFQDTTNVPDDRYLGGGPGGDGTGTVPHVVIVTPLPGANPALDVTRDATDLGG